jgi:hypothetical protein
MGTISKPALKSTIIQPTISTPTIQLPQRPAEFLPSTTVGCAVDFITKSTPQGVLIAAHSQALTGSWQKAPHERLRQRSVITEISHLRWMIGYTATAVATNSQAESPFLALRPSHRYAG